MLKKKIMLDIYISH